MCSGLSCYCAYGLFQVKNMAIDDTFQSNKGKKPSYFMILQKVGSD